MRQRRLSLGRRTTNAPAAVLLVVLAAVGPVLASGGGRYHLAGTPVAPGHGIVMSETLRTGGGRLPSATPSVQNPVGRTAMGGVSHEATGSLPANSTWINAAETANHLPFADELQAYDANDGYVVQVGGDSPGVLQTGTWTYHAGVWTNITGPVGPSSRLEESLAYDSTSKTVILFGGLTGCSKSGCLSELNDTWEFSKGSWTRLLVNGSAPSPRGFAALADDPPDDGLLLFGGAPHTGLALGDTWLFADGAWTQEHPVHSPSSRLAPGMAYDANESAVVAFGGAHLAGGRLTSLNDTWSYVGGDWTPVSSSLAPPAGVYNSELAYDSAIGRIMAVDRSADAYKANVTWELVAGNWSTIATSGLLPPTGAQNLVMDPADGYLLDTPAPTTLVGLPDLGFANGTWKAVDHGVRLPSARWYAAIAPDPDNGSSVLFGGYAPSADHADTWIFDGLTWRQLLPLTSPPARDGAGFAYDPSDHYDVLFGGIESGLYARDTWTFYAGDWHRFLTTHAPPALFGACLVDDPAINGLLLFGGYQSSGAPSNETWTFVRGNWTNVTAPHSPPARGLAACAFDGSSQSVIVFGGGTRFSFSHGSQFARSDTWSYANGTWSNLTGAVSPQPRDSALLGPVDAAGASGLLLEGGGNGLTTRETYYYDTWFWNGSGWTSLSPRVPGPANLGSAGIFLNTTSTFEAFGGLTSVAGIQTALNGTFAFDAPRLSPVAHIPVGPHSLDVTFSANASGEGTPASITWSFGDGTVGSGPLNNHTYPAPGDYPVTVSLRDLWGLGGSLSWQIHLPPPSLPLKVDVLATPTSGVAPLTVEFQASISGGVQPFQVNWTFGDGSAAIGSNVSYQYLQPSNYTAVVGVSDSIGENASAQTIIEVNATQVNPGGPVLTATLAPTTGDIPLDVRYNATVVDPYSPISFRWTFGDGSTSAASSGTHDYSAAGSFSVQVIVEDSHGQTAAHTWTVTAIGTSGTTHQTPALGGVSPLLIVGAVGAGLAIAGIVAWIAYRRRTS